MPIARPRIALLALTGVGLVAPILSGSRATADTLTVSVALRHDVHEARLQEAWDPGLAVEGSVALRRGGSAFRIGAETAPHGSRIPDAPDFRSVLVSGGWEKESRVLPSWSVFAGLGTGIFLMLFDDEAEPTVDPTESELAFAATGGLRRHAHRWSAGIAVQGRVIMTDPRITQLLVGLNVERMVATLP